MYDEQTMTWANVANLHLAHFSLATYVLACIFFSYSLSPIFTVVRLSNAEYAQNILQHQQHMCENEQANMWKLHLNSQVTYSTVMTNMWNYKLES